MKRLTYIFTILSFLLFPLSVFATTKVELKQVSNNEINTVIHFEDGFIGGIDLTLKLDKNIKVTNFKFNNSLSDKFTKEYDYKNNTLNIKITTGGVDKKHNLVNEKKELNVGSIFVEATTNTDYKIEAKILTVINNSLNSATINDLTTPTNEFTYKLSNTSSSTSKEENKDTETQDKDSSNKTDTDNNKDTVNKEDKENNTSNNQNTNTSTNKEDNNKTNSSNSNSNTNTSTNNNNKEETTNDKVTDKDKNDNKVEENKDTEEDNDNIENNNEKKEEQNDTKKEEKKNNKNITSTVILTGAGIVILSGIIFKVISIKKQ